MNHKDHVALIEKGITGGIWADLGSGHGAFTLALADVLGTNGSIYSIDRDRGSLRSQESSMKSQFPQAQVSYQNGDFTQSLDLPLLDGIIMANSLHYVSDKLPVLRRIMTYLKPAGHFIIIEYNTKRGNQWVPYPLTFDMWKELATKAGFAETTLLNTRPASFMTEFFSALSITLEED